MNGDELSRALTTLAHSHDMSLDTFSKLQCGWCGRRGVDLDRCDRDEIAGDAEAVRWCLWFAGEPLLYDGGNA